MSEIKNCFVISPIGEADSEIRKRADQILRHVIRPAVAAAGYTAVRADEIDKPGIITSQVIQHVVNDPLVIADLTDRNPNVFYELAIRHALRKPLVQLIKKGERIPFDVAGTRTIQVDNHDLDSVEGAKKEITTQIQSLERDPSDLETPISVSLDLQILRQSEKPEERSLADLVALVSELRSALGRIDTRIGGGDDTGILDEISSMLKALVRRGAHVDRPSGSAAARLRRLRPDVLRELTLGGPGRKSARSILIVASMVRDFVPWLYDIGVEAYRAVESNASNAGDSVREFLNTVEYAIQGPAGSYLMSDRQRYTLWEQLEPLMWDVRQSIS